MYKKIFWSFIIFSIAIFTEESSLIKVSEKKYFKFFMNKDVIKKIEKKSDAKKMQQSKKNLAENSDMEIVNPFEIKEVKEEIKGEEIKPLVYFPYSKKKIDKAIEEKELYVTKKGNIICKKEMKTKDILDKLYGLEGKMILFNNSEKKSLLEKKEYFIIEDYYVFLGLKDLNNSYLKEKSGIRMDLFVTDFQEKIY